MRGATCVAIARRVAHPQNGAVSVRARDPQQARRERGDEQRHCDRGRRRRAAVRVDVVAVEVDRFTAQQRGEHRDVLLGVATCVIVRVAVHAFDHRSVRRPDAQREPGATERVGDRQRALGHLQRMHRVRLHDRRPELDGGRCPSRERDRQQRVGRGCTRVPQRARSRRPLLPPPARRPGRSSRRHHSIRSSCDEYAAPAFRQPGEGHASIQ